MELLLIFLVSKTWRGRGICEKSVGGMIHSGDHIPLLKKEKGQACAVLSSQCGS